MAAGDKHEQLGPLGDEQVQKTLSNRAKLAQQQEAKDWESVASSPEGARVLGWVLGRCHLHQPSLVPDRPEVSALREGERNIGLMLLEQLSRVAPNAWKQITIDQMEAQLKARREHEDGVPVTDPEENEDA